MNILVVDDEKEIADVVELYLQNDQYKVFKFYNGQDALDCINSMTSRSWISCFRILTVSRY